MGEVLFHAVEAGFPDRSVTLRPRQDIANRTRLDRTRPVLGVTGPDNQAGVLEDLEVLGHRRELHIERLRQLTHRRNTVGEARQQRPTHRTRQGGEHVVQSILDVVDYVHEPRPSVFSIVGKYIAGRRHVNQLRWTANCVITKISDHAINESRSMTPTATYRAATARAIQITQAIRPDQLQLTTPCTEWNVQDVLDHLVGGTASLAAALGADPGDTPSGATVADLVAGVTACLDLLNDPTSQHHRSPSPLGFEWSGLEATAGTAKDILVHTWDLATATGQDRNLDPGTVAACIAMFLPVMPEHGRAAGIIGPAVAVPNDASPQDRLLAALGRHP